MNRLVSKGFTLVEMLVVISIIVILLTLLGIGLTRFLDKSEEVANTQFLKIVENTIEVYNTDFGHYPLYTESSWTDGHRGTIESVNQGLYTVLSGGGLGNRVSDGGVNYFEGVLSATSPNLEVTTRRVGRTTVTSGMILDNYGNPVIYMFDTPGGERPTGAPGAIGGLRNYFELWSMGPSGQFYNLTHSSIDKSGNSNRTEDDDNQIATNIGTGERFTE